MGEFHELLAYGQIGEGKIARWLRNVRGWAVLPVYETEIDTGKGPRLFMPGDSTLVAPDMLVFKGEKLIWVEAKRKSVFSWHRKTQQWVTGIDRHHYRQYLSVKKQTGYDVWLLFLHESADPWEGDKAYNCPIKCPVGLFACRVETTPNHIAPPARNGNGWGSTGMVYWNHGQLSQLATLEEMEPAAMQLMEAP